MKKLLIAISLFLCCVIYARQHSPFDFLRNLTGGTWQMKTKKGFTCEKWTIKDDNELVGLGFNVSGNDTIIQERVRLIKTENGIYFIPTVTNQNEGKYVRFKLTGSLGNEFIFSNPQHDFPQRIVYKFISRDSLHAWVDGQYNGQFVRQDFYYKRVK